jgi:hypothetical protein
MIPRLILFASLALLATPALAQNRAAPPPATPGCQDGSQAGPATAPSRNSGDGTAPGNAGSTGWSGGTGGSHIGTNPSGPVSTSRTWQPPTARGLDPIAHPRRPAASC